MFGFCSYAEALKIFPKTLSDNCGSPSTQGVGSNLVLDAKAAGITDLLMVKEWALKYATHAACTVLKVDNIIMAKPAGGPKSRDAGPTDQDDD
ncbi:unnamed protein product [Cyprideis torosa]|uniref:Uncharacterized protein n=1 Tax=Cyprideis torosa TaxID=163714 RepID=A0A7R8ZLV2_9CRUS|nr:unnamed protein product [Cyprideis torosa]CAG0884490.1 unnamed protein product [Cyprideis torosa]